jgi:hypothetical protein
MVAAMYCYAVHILPFHIQYEIGLLQVRLFDILALLHQFYIKRPVKKIGIGIWIFHDGFPYFFLNDTKSKHVKYRAE